MLGSNQCPAISSSAEHRRAKRESEAGEACSGSKYIYERMYGASRQKCGCSERSSWAVGLTRGGKAGWRGK